MAPPRYKPLICDHYAGGAHSSGDAVHRSSKGKEKKSQDRHTVIIPGIWGADSLAESDRQQHTNTSLSDRDPGLSSHRELTVILSNIAMQNCASILLHSLRLSPALPLALDLLRLEALLDVRLHD